MLRWKCFWFCIFAHGFIKFRALNCAKFQLSWICCHTLRLFLAERFVLFGGWSQNIVRKQTQDSRRPFFISAVFDSPTRISSQMNDFNSLIIASEMCQPSCFKLAHFVECKAAYCRQKKFPLNRSQSITNFLSFHELLAVSLFPFD
jgi:hypothetical protein